MEDYKDISDSFDEAIKMHTKLLEQTIKTVELHLKSIDNLDRRKEISKLWIKAKKAQNTGERTEIINELQEFIRNA